MTSRTTSSSATVPKPKRAGKVSTCGRSLTPLVNLEEAAECLKALAHPHRLRMVQMLLGGEYTVGQLATACEIPSHMASEHLRLMQRCGFLKSKKVGRQVFYQVAEPHLSAFMQCIENRFDRAAS